MKLVTIIKKQEIKKLNEFLECNPSKKDKIKKLDKELTNKKNELLKLKEPIKNFGNFDKMFITSKYKNYQQEYKEYESKKNILLNAVNEIKNDIKMIETDQEYDVNRNKVIDLIPLIESAKTIEEVAIYTFYGKIDVISNSKYLFAIFLLMQNMNAIKSDQDVEEIYNDLDLFTLNNKLKEIDLESLIRNLKKVKIDIDDGFYQLINMLLNENSLCTEVNLMTSLPILKQLKEDKEVPKNIRIALETLDNNQNQQRTIHDIGCEIFLKEVFSIIKENLNV